MAYFKYSISFLNTLNFETSSYTELDDYLKGVVKGYLSHNQGFLQEAPTQEELTELKNEIENAYSQMLLFVKPKYEEVLRLANQTLFENENITTNEYGNETQTGSFYEPKDNNTQAQINTNGQEIKREDDKTTTTIKEYKTLDDQAIKDFFVYIKEDVELYFIDFVNLYAVDDGGEIGFNLSVEQLNAINSGINANKVEQIETNKNNISTLGSVVEQTTTEIENLNTRVSSNEADILSIDGRLTNVESDIAVIEQDITGLKNRAISDEQNITSNTNRISQAENDITSLESRTTNVESKANTNQSNITSIQSKIPTQASSTNQLADKSFVNSTVQDAGASKQDKITSSNKLSYILISDTPTIPTVNNPTITITQGGATKGSFTLNQNSAQTIALDSGGSGSILDSENTFTQKNIFNKTFGTLTNQLALHESQWDIFTCRDTTNTENKTALGKGYVWCQDNNGQVYSQFKSNGIYYGNDNSGYDGTLLFPTSSTSGQTRTIATDEDLANKVNLNANNLTSSYVYSWQTKLNDLQMPSLTGSTTQIMRGQAIVKETYLSSDKKTWYRLWSDGWKECGFVDVYTSSWTYNAYALPITFSNTNYVINISRYTSDFNKTTHISCNAYKAKTTSSFSTYADSNYMLSVYCCGF